MLSILLRIALLYLSAFPKNTLSVVQEASREYQEILFDNLTKSPYNVRVRPNATNGFADKIYTSFYVYSIASIDEIRTEYTMQLLYRQSWIDERLKFSKNQWSVIMVHGDNWHAKRIWTPAIHAVNDKDIGSFSDVSQGTVLLQIDHDGRVLISKRVKLRPACKMEFYKYPMDKQTCTLKLESSILPTSDLELLWMDDMPLDLHPDIAPPGFTLTNHSVEESVSFYRMTGNFSRITASFALQRNFGHFVMDVYIPSALFVVTSWLSFYIEIPAAPARVTLSMTTMLTLVTSEKALREKLPKVSYVHALDVWNVVCTGTRPCPCRFRSTLRQYKVLVPNLVPRL